MCVHQQARREREGGEASCLDTACTSPPPAEWLFPSVTVFDFRPLPSSISVRGGYFRQLRFLPLLSGYFHPLPSLPLVRHRAVIYMYIYAYMYIYIYLFIHIYLHPYIYIGVVLFAIDITSRVMLFPQLSFINICCGPEMGGLVAGSS